ncbi:hypothetical protein OKW34_005522 [Paraburkholderia youngii]|uniref:hypothetical protein n=1 Tax=Paraburkholderia youngii TaxID=2782701 RepID=UPI003D1B7CCF
MMEAQAMTVSPRAEPRVMNDGERSGIERVNPLLQISPTRPTSVAAELALRERGIDVTEEARALNGTEKLSLLRSVDRHFDATPQEQALHCDFHDAVRTTWAKINPLRPENVARYRSFGDAIKSGNPQLMPVAQSQGAGYVLCCAGGSGGLRFVERTTQVLGSSMSVLPVGDDTFIPYWPAMVVHWPACGTLDQFQANFISVFDGNARDSQYFRTVFRASAKRATRPIYVTALASIVNVGVLFVVGASSSNFKEDKSRNILGYLEEFMRRTGIVVVFVCTAPVYEKLEHMGTICSSLTTGGMEEIQWLDTKSKFFQTINLNLLNQGLMWDTYDEVPGYLLNVASKCTYGSREALNTFYRYLHIAAVRAKAKQPSEQLIESVVKVFMRQTNQLQKVGGFLGEFYAKQNERNGKSGPTTKLPDGRVWEDFLALQTLELMGLAG